MFFRSLCPTCNQVLATDSELESRLLSVLGVFEGRQSQFFMQFGGRYPPCLLSCATLRRLIVYLLFLRVFPLSQPFELAALFTPQSTKFHLFFSLTLLCHSLSHYAPDFELILAYSPAFYNLRATALLAGKSLLTRCCWRALRWLLWRPISSLFSLAPKLSAVSYCQLGWFALAGSVERGRHLWMSVWRFLVYPAILVSPIK